MIKRKNRRCKKRAVAVTSSFLHDNIERLKQQGEDREEWFDHNHIYAPQHWGIKHDPDTRCYNDLYVHADNRIQVEDFRKQFLHTLFYTYGNESLYQLPMEEQLAGLIRMTSHKLDIVYDEAIFVDENGAKQLDIWLPDTVQQIPDKPKVAVILAGQPRLAEESLPILHEWLEGTDYKIFAHAWETVGGVDIEGNPSISNSGVRGFKYTNIDQNLKNFIIDALSDHYLKFGNNFTDVKIPQHADAYEWDEEKTLENLILHEPAVWAQGFPGWISWWNSYNYAIELLEQSNMHFDIVLRSRWDNFYDLNFPLINFLKTSWRDFYTNKDGMDNTIKDNTIYIAGMDPGYSEDPRNYPFFEYFHGHDVLPKDHYWIGTQDAQIKLLKYWLDFSSCTVLEHENILFNTRKFPWPEFFLYTNVIKSGLQLEVQKLPMTLGRAGCDDYRDFNKVLNNTIRYYKASIEHEHTPINPNG